MIKRLRTRFIRITILSVLAVMIVLSLTVNVANFLSTDSDLNNTLNLIYENQGSIPTDISKKTTSVEFTVENSSSDESNPADESIPADGEGLSKPEAPPSDTAASESDSAKTPKETPDKKNTPPEEHNSRSSQFNKETPYSTRYFVLHIQNDEVESSNLDNIASITEEEISTYAAVALKHKEGTGYYKTYKYTVKKQSDGRYMAIFLECSQELRAIRTVAFWSVVSVVVCIAVVTLLVMLLSRKAIDPTIQAAAKQKQFITDATHELKTPLTVINTSLSVLEMEVGEQKWIEKAKGQTAKMSSLINELISLSKLDEEEPRIQKTDFCLSETVAEMADSFKDAAESEGFSFHTAITPGIDYHGEEASLRRLVSILLDNALKYAVPESEITLSLEKKHHSVILRQTNLCAPIEKEALNKLFDRFYRPDCSRSSETGGFGIGLSLAKSIAEAHGGTITATCPAENQICFTVTL